MKFDINNYKSLLKVTGLFSSVHGLSLVLNIARGKLAAMLIGPAGKGLNDLYNETRELIHTVTNCGLDFAGVRGISQKYELWNKESDIHLKQQHYSAIEEQIMLLRTWILIFAILGTLVCLFLAEPISWLTFRNLDHVSSFILLSPAIGFSTMICGEMTILKANRRLKALATISVVNVILAIIVTLPFYQIMGLGGIVYALVVLSLVQFLAVCSYSYRLYMPRFCFNRIFLKAGVPMMRVGIAFTLTNIVNHGVQLAIRSILNNQAGGGEAGLSEVGLYGAGYAIAISYAGVIFASLDQDYFPRLTGVIDDQAACRQAVWRQVKLSLALAIPFSIAIIIFLPWILPLLNTEMFNGAIRMAQYATIGLVFRAIYLPLAYLPLAAGHSLTYMCLEFLSYVVLFISVICGYQFMGLDGSGIGLTIAIFFDMCVCLTVAKIKYKM